jgi:nucleoside-diphosphate-sugar epimerase
VLDIAGPPERSKMTHHRGSVLDDSLVKRLIPGCDIVVHLAGIAEPMRYGSDPLATMDVNLIGSINVVRRCAEYGIPVVFASTSEVYGLNPELPWREDANRVLGPVANVRWCYSSAKVAVEHYLDACRRQLGLDYTVVRLFNTYGSGLRGRVVDGFIRRALAGEPLVIHGNGQQTRCFCHIDDVAEALLRILTRPMVGAHTSNIWCDRETSILDLGRLIIELCGSRSALQTVPISDLYDGYQDVPRRLRRLSTWTDPVRPCWRLASRRSRVVRRAEFACGGPIVPGASGAGVVRAFRPAHGAHGRLVDRDVVDFWPVGGLGPAVSSGMGALSPVPYRTEAAGWPDHPGGPGRRGGQPGAGDGGRAPG